MRWNTRDLRHSTLFSTLRLKCNCQKYLFKMGAENVQGHKELREWQVSVNSFYELDSPFFRFMTFFCDLGQQLISRFCCFSFGVETMFFVHPLTWVILENGTRLLRPLPLILLVREELKWMKKWGKENSVGIHPSLFPLLFPAVLCAYGSTGPLSVGLLQVGLCYIYLSKTLTREGQCHSVSWQWWSQILWVQVGLVSNNSSNIPCCGRKYCEKNCVVL